LEKHGGDFEKVHAAALGVMLHARKAKAEAANQEARQEEEADNRRVGNVEGQKVGHFGGLSPEAAKVLVMSRKWSGVLSSRRDRVLREMRYDAMRCAGEKASD
jgi:hypothetical protein